MKDDQPLNPVLNLDLLKVRKVQGKPQKRSTEGQPQNLPKTHSSARVIRNFKSPIKVMRNEDA